MCLPLATLALTPSDPSALIYSDMPQEEASQEADDEMSGMTAVVGFANDELATDVAIAAAATQGLD